MRVSGRSAGAARVIGLVSISVISCVIFWYVRRQETMVSPAVIVNPLRAAPSATEERPRSESLPADLLSALESPNDFRLRHKVADIPDAVRAAFARAAHMDTFSMAEPGARWQSTDVITTPPLPWRRLVAVATTDSFCLILYQRGGLGESNNAAVFRLSTGAVEPVGHAYIKQGIVDPAALRRSIDSTSTLDAAFF